MMMLSDDTLIRTIDQNFEKELVSEGALAPLNQLRQTSPVVWNHVELECRLKSDDECVDWIAEVTPCNGGRARLAGWEKDPWLNHACEVSAVWQQIRRLAQQWGDPASPLARWVPSLYLEFDADALINPIPEPSVFAILDSPAQRLPVEQWQLRYPECQTALEVGEILQGIPVSTEEYHFWRHCFEALPSMGRMLYIGVMLGREENWIRFSVSIPPDQAVAYLQQIDPNGDLGDGEAFLAEYAPFLGNSVQLDFEAHHTTLFPKLAITFPTQTQDLRQPLLDKWVQAGLCSPTKAQLLTQDTPHRQLSCFKLSYAPHSPLVAKSYLRVMESFVAQVENEGSLHSPQDLLRVLRSFDGKRPD